MSAEVYKMKNVQEMGCGDACIGHECAEQHQTDGNIYIVCIWPQFYRQPAVKGEKYSFVQKGLSLCGLQSWAQSPRYKLKLPHKGRNKAGD